MKRLTKLELLGIVFGAIIFCFGLCEVIWPKPGVMILAVNGRQGSGVAVDPLVVSTVGARVYGVLEILGGIGIVVLSAYRPKR